jgi:hypothetical protein
MSFLSVARTVVNFNDEEEVLQYLTDALTFITNNYKNKVCFEFKQQEFHNNIELIQLLMSIINKIKVKKNNSSNKDDSFDSLHKEETI